MACSSGFLLLATFRQQKPALPTLEAKRRAGSCHQAGHGGTPIRACQQAERFALHPKQLFTIGPTEWPGLTLLNAL
jgi:hypothetical protein